MSRVPESETVTFKFTKDYSSGFGRMAKKQDVGVARNLVRARGSRGNEAFGRDRN